MNVCEHHMMEDNIKQLVADLVISPVSIDVINNIAYLLEEQTPQSLTSFVSESFQSLLTIEHWAWQILSKDFRQWTNQPSYSKLFHALQSFNMKLLLNNDE